MAKEINRRVVLTSQVLADAIGLLPGEVRVNNPPPVVSKPNINVSSIRNIHWGIYHGSVVRARDDKRGN